MTHKLTIKDKEYLLVGCPKDINKFVIKNYGYAGKWLEGIEDSKLNSWKVKIDNENTYQIINTISNLTEKECKELVEYSDTREFMPSVAPHYYDYLDTNKWDYTEDSGNVIYGWKTAKESFISLLKSKNILAKSFVDEPKVYDREKHTIYFDEDIFKKDLEKYQNLPDELLLIQINN